MIQQSTQEKSSAAKVQATDQEPKEPEIQAAEPKPDVTGNQSENSQAELVIQQLEQQLADSKDSQLRILAEAENIKKRASKDIESTRKFSLEGFIKSLLPVLDSFNGAKKTISATQKELLTGVEMIENNFIEVLNSHQVEVINPAIGELFNPDVHQAMTTVPAKKGQESNTVVEVFQRGFSLHGRLIRPALVVVIQ